MDAWKIKNNTVLILCRVFGFVNGVERLLIGQKNKSQVSIKFCIKLVSTTYVIGKYHDIRKEQDI